MATNITTVYFDLGYTLLDFKGNVPRTLRKSYIALADSLIQHGCQIQPKPFARQYQQIINRYYAAREEDYIEQPVSLFVNRTLASFGQPPASEKIFTEAISSMFRVTEAHWHLEKDTHYTLSALKSKGYHLCIISNASNIEDLNNLVDNADLRKYFDHIVISAAEGIRKPHIQIYKKALSVMNTDPHKALMVGDTLTADIFGAQQAGIRAAWITRRAKRPENLQEKKRIKPDFKISNLTSLLRLMDSL